MSWPSCIGQGYEDFLLRIEVVDLRGPGSEGSGLGLGFRGLRFNGLGLRGLGFRRFRVVTIREDSPERMGVRGYMIAFAMTTETVDAGRV